MSLLDPPSGLSLLDVFHCLCIHCIRYEQQGLKSFYTRQSLSPINLLSGLDFSAGILLWVFMFLAEQNPRKRFSENQVSCRLSTKGLKKIISYSEKNIDLFK
jgi:hypothetical protein